MTHTYVLTQSMVVEGVDVKKERQEASRKHCPGGEKRQGGICPCSGSHKWPSEQEVGAPSNLELEQEVLNLLEESFKVQEFLFHKALVNI